MKKLFGLLFLSLLAVACQDSNRREILSPLNVTKVPDSIQVLKGEFVHVKGAAVLRGEGFVYGVLQDSMFFKLADTFSTVKAEDFEMVPVTLKAKIVPNPEQEGWEEVIEIREIMKVPEANASDSLENRNIK
ncbi:hypothetical protein [Christiangramia aquimixticola]|uniref:hypothetical protein n=1 Tax=Christiangramia aquimixticola TaxID=1697558 RepID=UPI003AA8883B